MEFEGYLRFVLALAFVLGLIGVLALLAKRFNLGFPTPMKTGKGRRIRVIEVQPLDARRRLVLLRRDAVEHLVLIGPGQDLVIERGIPAPPEAGDPAPLPEAKP